MWFVVIELENIPVSYMHISPFCWHQLSFGRGRVRVSPNQSSRAHERWSAAAQVPSGTMSSGGGARMGGGGGGRQGGMWARTLKHMMRRHAYMSPPYLAVGLAVGATAICGSACMWTSCHKATSPSGYNRSTVASDGMVGRSYASSSSGEAQQASSKTMRFAAGASMLPHPDKEHRGGEDAYFIHSSEYCLGVADGVGGWAEVGVDPGLYSRELMNHSVSLLDALDSEIGIHSGTPQDVLEGAHAKTKARGSCTACILCLFEGRVHAANLGDSGFLIARQGVVEYVSPQQQHEFNFPYQIGSPDSMSDLPSAANRHVVDVQHGDVLVAATDGLFDNVFPDEAAAIVGMSKEKGHSPKEAADLLAKFARTRAADPKHLSPFAYGAQQLGYRYLGGKMDDITVVVAYIQEDEEEKNAE